MNFFHDMISGRNGRVSSKRCMSMISFLVIIQAVQMNLFSGAKLDMQLLTILVALVFGLSGAATIENMATKSPDASKKVTETKSSNKTEVINE